VCVDCVHNHLNFYIMKSILLGSALFFCATLTANAQSGTPQPAEKTHCEKVYDAAYNEAICNQMSPEAANIEASNRQDYCEYLVEKNESFVEEG